MPMPTIYKMIESFWQSQYNNALSFSCFSIKMAYT